MRACGIHHLRRHALVLNAVVGHDGGRDVTGDIGIVEVVVFQDGLELMQGVEVRPQQFVAYVPKRLQAAAAFISLDI